MKQGKIKYFLYARKSCENEDRQVQSIDDQIKKLKELSNDFGIEIKKIYTEAKSAKKPNNRPIFDEMLERIEGGDAEGILCWQINRLSRNPIDSAKIQWLLQQDTIKSIRTIDREYLPDDNVLLFNVESGMANQFILDLRKNVKRGMDSKLEKGWRPGVAPAGYLNDKAEKTIIKDPERFDLVRKMWDLMLTGNYSIPHITKIANKEWGFITHIYKKQGGTKITQGAVWRIFNNIFYTGTIAWKDKYYEGKHEPMITMDEFNRVQSLLGKGKKIKPKTHSFSYTGMLRCGECRCAITAEIKTKKIKSTGEIKSYTYYHCTKKKVDHKCSQPCITEPELEKQIEEELECITILPKFKDWALEFLNRNNDKEIYDRAKIYEMQHKKIVATQKQLDNLTKMRYREMITDEEFTKERDLLQKEILTSKDRLRNTEKRADDWLTLTEKVFEFATHARANFNDGDLMKKKEVVRTLGVEFILKDKNIQIKLKDYFQAIKDKYPAIEKEYLRLEPTKFGLNKGKNTAFDGVHSTWL